MRKSKPKKRIILPDPKFNDPRVTRFVNDMMWEGKKSVSFKIFYDSLEIIEKKMKDSEDAPIDIWRKALDNVTPAVEVKSRRIGGATFQVPTEIRADRKISVSHKWLIAAARKRSGQSMANRLAAEIMAAYNNEGAAVKRKDETHRMAEANKAFAHFKF
ncbi:MAG TPA: 30S ribosomal protein S7 [Bacteroidales bacterium]|nr:30S ribosomal protein S7 [Bacteroidales bacterium]HQB20796.1 30S ribosomal protein S7 [Bacteroidales bacterium]